MVFFEILKPGSVNMRLLRLFRGRSIRSRSLIFAAGTIAAVASMALPSFGGIVTFGSGSNTFQMEFVTIGNPGNAADTTGAPNPAGAVGYTYGIGKFEVSEDMINKYNASQPGGILQITKDTRGTNKPATSITWNEAARFVNWLNTSTGNQAAYKFTTSGVNDNIALWTSADAGYDVNNKYRNSLAKYFLPSYNEWYKAAYYDPNKSGSDKYWDYATGSNTAPTAVASGTDAGTAVYNVSTGQADVDQAGGLSPYGVMGLGGNVWEWEESSFDLANSNRLSNRAVRGASSWTSDSSVLSSSWRDFEADPRDTDNDFGFRVAMFEPVPEPSMMVIGTLFGLGSLVAKRRMKR